MPPTQRIQVQEGDGGRAFTFQRVDKLDSVFAERQCNQDAVFEKVVVLTAAMRLPDHDSRGFVADDGSRVIGLAPKVVHGNAGINDGVSSHRPRLELPARGFRKASPSIDSDTFLGSEDVISPGMGEHFGHEFFHHEFAHRLSESQKPIGMIARNCCRFLGKAGTFGIEENMSARSPLGDGKHDTSFIPIGSEPRDCLVTRDGFRGQLVDAFQAFRVLELGDADGAGVSQ